MTTLSRRAPRFGRLAAATILTCAATAAHADAAGTWYAGLAHHDMEAAVDIEYGWLVGPDSTGFELSGGRRVSDHFAVDFGLLRSTGLAWGSDFVSLSTLARVETVFDVTALQVAAVGILPFGRVWEVSLKGGFAYADLSGRQSVTKFRGASFEHDVSADSTDVLFGLGIGADVTQRWHIRLDIESFWITPGWLGHDLDTSIDSWSLGAQYRFGERAASRD